MLSQITPKKERYVGMSISRMKKPRDNDPLKFLAWVAICGGAILVAHMLVDLFFR